MFFKKALKMLVVLIALSVAFTSFSVLNLTINTATACDNDGTCDTGEDAVDCPADCAWASPPTPGNVPQDLTTSLVNMTNWILGFIGLIAILFIIYGGVLYLTSAGDDSRVENGKKTITYALMGLVIAGLAYAIVNVIISVILV